MKKLLLLISSLLLLYHYGMAQEDELKLKEGEQVRGALKVENVYHKDMKSLKLGSLEEKTTTAFLYLNVLEEQKELSAEEKDLLEYFREEDALQESLQNEIEFFGEEEEVIYNIYIYHGDSFDLLEHQSLEEGNIDERQIPNEALLILSEDGELYYMLYD